MEREHAIGKLRLALTGPLDPFGKYGMLVYIPQAKEAIIGLAEQYLEDRLPEILHAERVAMRDDVLRVLDEYQRQVKQQAAQEETAIEESIKPD